MTSARLGNKDALDIVLEGDDVSATRKGANLPDRTNQVAFTGQMQDIIDFLPIPTKPPGYNGIMPPGIPK
jgi:hypothetical protein